MASIITISREFGSGEEPLEKRSQDACKFPAMIES